MQKLIKLFHIVKHGFLSDLIINNVAASVEHRNVLSYVNCKHVIDIGANRGQFSLMARKYFPNAKIDSFEPLIKLANGFESLFSNDNNVFLHKCAIGSANSQATLYVSNRDDSSSLFPIGKKQIEIFPGTQESYHEVVTVAPLKDYIQPQDLIAPVFVKIDVQGFELVVIKGCTDLIEAFDYIYVECSFIELYQGQSLADEIIRYLANYSFKLHGVYNIYYDNNGIAIQGDFLFIK